MWSRRCEGDEGRWRGSAPALGAAMLQLHAAPDSDALCNACGQAKGCIIRCVLTDAAHVLLFHKLLGCNICVQRLSLLDVT